MNHNPETDPEQQPDTPAGQAADMERMHRELHRLRQAYVRNLPDKLATIAELWQQMQQHWSRETCELLHRNVHGLAGSGATYGLEELGTAACRLEQRLLALLEAGHPPDEQHTATLGTLYVELCTAANAIDARDETTIEQADSPPLPSAPTDSPGAPTSTPAPIAPIASIASIASMVIRPPDFPLLSSRGSSEDNRLIYLLAERNSHVQDLVLQIGHFGYLVEVVDTPEHLAAATRQMRPAAILRDIATLRPDEIAPEMPPYADADIPTMYLADRGDFQSRLHAVRAGGRAYFVHPIDVGSLVDRLDDLTIQRQPEPYRILIVEDEESLADYYAAVLQRAGMTTVTVTDPLRVLAPLIELNPDLILMDVFMPGCTGLEAATIIRQQEAYVGIPIVFLSAETRRDKQLKAMHQGGDDFLTKPISQDHLISAITSRALRSRALRASMSRDGLTGLLNHTTTKEQLDRELNLAMRREGWISLALLDLDYFKSINDTYGHSTGDRVLKSLSRVLQQRLRKTDIIGRYGGEEFAVIMTDTDGEYAARVLDEIRRGFARIRQRADKQEQEFSVTFSGGVASFPIYQSVTHLSKAADLALYAAKYQGRNQIVLANSQDFISSVS